MDCVRKNMELDKEKQRREIERFIEKIPSLSTTVGKVMEVCSRTDASPNELHKVISLDPVLTGQVLKLVNSAYYSLINKVTSLARAITMLGMNTVKNMALSTAIISTVGATKRSQVLPVAKFWAHSIATGVSAKLLGEEIGGMDTVERDELFLAGLLHDLGKVPFGTEYAEVLRLAEQEQIPLIDAERQLMGLDHQQVGTMIAEKWQLNTGLYNCIAHHHDIDSIGELGESAHPVAIVALGDLYANILDLGFAGNRYPREEDVSILLQRVGVPDDVFSGIGERVEEEIRLAEIFLQI